MATLTGKLVADTYKALLKLIDNDVLTASEKQISDGFGGGSSVFIDQNGFLRATQFKVTGGTSSQFLKGNGSLDNNSYYLASNPSNFISASGTSSQFLKGDGSLDSNIYYLASNPSNFIAASGTSSQFLKGDGSLDSNIYYLASNPSNFIAASGTSSQFLKGDGSLDSNSYYLASNPSGFITEAFANTLYLPIGSTTSAIAEGSNLYFTTGRVLAITDPLYLPIGSTTTAIAEGTRLYFTTARVLATTLEGFVATSGTVTASDTILTAIDKIWWNIVNGGGGGYVPYTGATQNLDLGTYGLISDFVKFNVSNSAVPTTAGTMSWNNTDGTADLKLKGGNVTLQVGQEQVTRVVNKTGVNLLEANYQAVYISGAQGQRLKVDLALAVTDGTSAGTLGLVTENINNNQEGFVTSSGLVNEIDTTGDLQGETWADGDILYLSPITAGNITNIKPLAPEHTVIMGFVVYAHAIHGKIYVKVDNGYEIEELHDVQVIDRTDTDILQWYEDDLVWRNIQLATAIQNAGILTSTGTVNYVARFDGTNSISNSRIFDDLDNVIIGGTVGIIPNPFGSADMLTVLNGNIAIDGAYSYRIDTHQILQRTNATGEFRIGTDVAGDFITLYAGTSERARITAAGYLGLGVTTPLSIIHAKDSTAYPKIIIDNTGATGGGMFSARQNGVESAIFGLSGGWESNTTSNAAVVAATASQGILFYTNGTTTAKGGINSVGNSFIGQLPLFYAGATNFLVQGISAAALVGITHFDGSIKGVFSTLNSGVNIGSETPHPLIFRIDDIENARLTEVGYFGIGISTPSSIIHAKDSTAYGKIIIDNTGSTGGGSFSARQNGTETAIFGVSGSWAANTTSDAAIVATRAGQGIKFYTNGSATAKGGIDSVGNSFIGQLPAYYTGATNFIVQGISAAAMVGITHADNSIKGVFSTLNGGITFGSYTPHPVIFFADEIESARIASDGKWLFGTNVNDNVNTVQVNGSLIATSLKKSGGTSSQFLKADGSVDTNTYYPDSNPSGFIPLTAISTTAFGLTYTNTTGVISLTAGFEIPTTTDTTNWDITYLNRITSATAPLNITTNVISISQASGSVNGYLSSTDWTTFNNKANTFSGTNNYIPKFTSSNTIGNSLIYDNGATITVSGTVGLGLFNVQGSISTLLGLARGIHLSSTLVADANGDVLVGLDLNPTFTNGAFTGVTNYALRIGSWLYADSINNSLGIGTATPIHKLDVNGTGRFSGVLTLGSTISNGTYTYTLPSATGTLALTSALSGYLPLTGGTLTGALGGTSASFSSSVTAGDLISTSYGTARIQVTSTTNSANSGFRLSAKNSSGTSKSSGLYFTSGTTNANTYLSLYADDNNPQFNVTAAGNVGINTTSPNLSSYGTALTLVAASGYGGIEVYGSGSTNGGQIDFGSGTTRYASMSGEYESSNNGLIQIRTRRAGSMENAVRINSSGQVGIGTTSVNRALVVSGGNSEQLVLISSTTSCGISLNPSNTSFSPYIGATGNDIILQTNGAERMRITSGGDFAIGTSSPSSYGSQKFLVVGSTAGQVARFTDGANADIVFDNPSAGITRITAQYGAAGTLVFASGTGFNERMRINSNGGVNINSTNTGYTLNVVRSVSTTATRSYRGTGESMQIMGRILKDETNFSGVAFGYLATSSSYCIYGNATNYSLELGAFDGSLYKTKLVIYPTGILMDLPTSSSGLSNGGLWNDGGTVKIVV